MTEHTTRAVHLDRLADWEPFGEPGEAAGQVSWISRGDDGRTAVGIWRVEPADMPENAEVQLPTDETVHALAGHARLILEDGETIDLTPGVVAFLPAGTVSRWTILESFTELFVSSKATGAPQNGDEDV